MILDSGADITGVVCLSFVEPLREVSLLAPSTAASPTHISKSSFVLGLGAGLVPSWADSDYGRESDVSGEATF